MHQDVKENIKTMQICKLYLVISIKSGTKMHNDAISYFAKSYYNERQQKLLSSCSISYYYFVSGFHQVHCIPVSSTDNTDRHDIPEVLFC
jgi:hypothetical protein